MVFKSNRQRRAVMAKFRFVRPGTTTTRVPRQFTSKFVNIELTGLNKEQARKFKRNIQGRNIILSLGKKR